MNRPPRSRYSRLLRQDLLGEVPGQQQDVVGHRSTSARAGRSGRAPGHEPALLVGAAVGDEVERLAADPEGVEQRAALGRRRRRRRARLPCALQLPQQRRELASAAARPGAAKSAVGVAASPTPQRALLLEQRSDGRARVARSRPARRRRRSEPPWIGMRSTSSRTGRDARTARDERGQREVAEVLVVDRVELAGGRAGPAGRAPRSTATPSGAEQPTRCPATKPFRSATWARTLLAWMTSARGPSARSCAAQTRGRRTRDGSGCPARSATARDVARRARCPAPGSRPSRSTGAGSRRCSPPRRPGSPGRGLARRRAARPGSRRARTIVVGERREVEVLAEELLGRHGVRDLHERADGAEQRRRAGTRASGVSRSSGRSERVRERRRAEDEEDLDAAPRRSDSRRSTRTSAAQAHTFQGAARPLPTAAPAGASRAACPCTARSPRGGRP